MTETPPLKQLVSKYTGEWPDTTWHAARHLTQAVVWNWFGDHGCFIGPGGPLSSDENYTSRALTDPTMTPFERFFYHPPTPQDPHAFIAVRPLPSKQCKGRLSDSHGILGDIRLNLRSKSDGLVVFSLSPFLVCKASTESEEEHRDWPPEACFEVTEEELCKTYGSEVVRWV
jgi:hypothetical protein